MSDHSSHYLFKDHPGSCDPGDIWGQVKRTVGGKPVSPEQIELIVDAVCGKLGLTPRDRLLDLCCGNGALTTQFFAACGGGLGVDYSGFLIDVAKRRFVRRPSEGYLLADALDYVTTGEDSRSFTKMVCYGAFPYFGDETAIRLLAELGRRFERITHVFLGQIPDKTRLDAFYGDRARAVGEENDPGGLLGVWRTPAEMAELAARSGWMADCVRMPETFYASHYRFDAILTRA